MLHNFLSIKKTFTPNSLRDEGVAGVWYDTSDSRVIIQSSGAVTDLYDRLGQDIDLAQATAGKRPTTGTRSINGVNVLDYVAVNTQSLFDDTNTVATTLSGSDKAFAFYAVVQKDLTGLAQAIVSVAQIASSNPYLVFRINLTEKLEVTKRDDSLNVLTKPTTAVIDTTPHIVSSRFDGVDLRLYVDGILDSIQDLSSTLGVCTFDQLRIGSHRDVSNFLDGGIGDTIILTSNPTDDIDSKIIGFLAWKYSLFSQLDYNQAYRFDGTLFGRYTLWKPTTADIASLVHIEPNAVANVTQSAGAVSQLTTVQGSLTLEQSTGSKQPSIIARTINGVRVLDFISANSQSLFDNTNAIATALSGTNKPFAFYAVIQRDALDALHLILNIESTVSGVRYIALRITTANKVDLIRGDDASATSSVLSTATVGTTPTIVSVRYDGANVKLYINGSLDTTQASSLGNITLDQVRIGSYRDTQQYFDGAIGSVLAMAENPSDEMHEKIEGFLAHQYKLTANLPSAHPYKTNPPLE